MTHPPLTRLRAPAVWLCVGLSLASCAAPQGDPDVSRAAKDGAAQGTASLPRPPQPQARHNADGTCYAAERTPAVYEQVPGLVQVVQAEIARDGTVLRPPIYRKGPVPKVVQARGEIRFAAPCPERMTPDFIASVQRALGARGYHRGAVTGLLDAATQGAIRRYQAERGLDSGQLSLETARALGLVAVERPTDG